MREHLLSAEARAAAIPLLSICIPTFNRADLLELCLSTVLPQVLQFADEVECVVSDNASSDRTAAVMSEYTKLYSLRYFRNEENIGIIANITKCASELALGEFILMIGDDDTLCAGSLEKILRLLRRPDAPDLVALNVGFLPRQERPAPADALAGIQATTTKCLRNAAKTGIVEFSELLEGPCADFTAMYSGILRRALWLRYFPTACADEPFTSVRTTYPNAYVIANTMPKKLAGSIADVAIMIYEIPGSEFSWAKYRALNSLIHATQLLDLYRVNGVPRQVLKPYYLYQLKNRGNELGELLWNPKIVGGFSRAIQFAWLLRRYPFQLVQSFLVAMNHPNAPWILSSFTRLLLRLKQLSKRN